MPEPTSTRTPALWVVRASLIVVGAVLAAFPLATDARAFLAICKNCGRSYSFPGPGTGALRINGCVACKDSCADAAKEAARLHNNYAKYWPEYAKVRTEVTALMSAGKPVPRALSDREANLNFMLDQLAAQWAILKETCPDAVKGNVWDGIDGAGPPQPIYGNDTGAEKRIALSGEKTYTRLAAEEWQAVDVLDGVLGPAANDFPGSRVRVARAYGQLAAAYGAEAARLKADPPAKPDPKANFNETAKPDLFAIKNRKGFSEAKNRAADYAEVRLNAAEYLLASYRAAGLARAAQAAGDKDARARQAHAALEYAWLAGRYFDFALVKGFEVEVAYQKALDASLEKAAKAGIRIADLLANFQKQVKESGLPEHLKDALKEGGATDAQVEATKKRLLELKPEDMENFLTERRARFGPKAKDPPPLSAEWAAADTQLLLARKGHEPKKK